MINGTILILILWISRFYDGNIPQSPSYGVYISLFIRYARASTLYDGFLSRSMRLTPKLFRQGYERFKTLVDRYNIFVTHIISDLF